MQKVTKQEIFECSKFCQHPTKVQVDQFESFSNRDPSKPTFIQLLRNTIHSLSEKQNTFINVTTKQKIY